MTDNVRALNPSTSLLDGLKDGDYLNREIFGDLRWAVPALLPEGLTVLVGAPKVGKSWLTFHLALTVATGARALGQLHTGRARPVLHLALEDGHRRLQARGRTLLGGNPFPQLWTYKLDVEPGMVVETITEWLDQPKIRSHPEPPLVIVDTLGKVKPPAYRGESAYQHDYRVTGVLHRLCQERPGLALMVLHHDRKAGSDDFVQTVSGTNGIAGAADTILVLTRSRLEAVGRLQITGREVEEAEYALNFVGGVWSLQGDLTEAARAAAEMRSISALGELNGQLLLYVRAHPEGVSIDDVCKQFGIDSADARKRLSRLVEQGRITRPVRGTYAP